MRIIPRYKKALDLPIILHSITPVPAIRAHSDPVHYKSNQPTSACAREHSTPGRPVIDRSNSVHNSTLLDPDSPTQHLMPIVKTLLARQNLELRLTLPYVINKDRQNYQHSLQSSIEILPHSAKLSDLASDKKHRTPRYF